MSSGAMGKRGSTRWLVWGIIVAAVLFAVIQQPLDARGQEPADQVAELVAAGLIDASVAIDLTANGSVDAILVLHDAAIVAGYEDLKRSAGLTDDTAPILAAKSAEYAVLKSAVGQSAGSGMAVLQDYNHFATQHVEFTSLASLAAAASDPRTKVVAVNLIHEPALGQSLPVIQQPLAQLSGRTGAGVSVAVLDSGIDYLRPHFGCTGVNTPASTCKVVHMQDFAPNDGTLDDNSLHGTNVSGIVSAVAPGAKVLGLDIFGAGGSATSADIVAALNFVVANQATYNIRAANMSIQVQSFRTTTHCTGTPYDSAFANLRTAGVIPVAAAGNFGFVGNAFSNGITVPACLDDALSVGLTYDSNLGTQTFSDCSDANATVDSIVCWSQSASILSMLAPGSVITAANVSQSGTSQATPHVAGAVAVLAAAVPSQDVDQREASLTGTGLSILDARNGVTKRRLDLCAALVNAGSSCPGGTNNDNRANAFEMTSSPALFRQSTAGFTVEGADPSPTCSFVAGQQAKSAWYKFTTGTAGNFSAQTGNSHYPWGVSSQDTLLALFADNAGTLSPVACDDDSSPETFLSVLSGVALQASKTYYLMVTTDPTNTSATGNTYLVLNASYTGTFGAGGGGVTDSIAWTGQPADRQVNQDLPTLTVQARDGGVINPDDDATQVTLSLMPAGNFTSGSLEIAGKNQPTPSRSAELQSRFGGRGLVRASFHDDGTLRSIAGLDGGLTDPAGGTPEQIATAFLSSIAGMRGVETGFDANLRVQKVDDSPNGLTVIGFRQEVAGLKLFDAYAKVGVNSSGAVISFSTDLVNGGDLVSGPATVDAATAIATAEAAVGGAWEIEVTDEMSAQAAALATPVAELQAYETDGGLGLGWVVFVYTPDDAFTVVIDALTGAVVTQFSMTAHVGPEGTVFTEHPDAGPREVISFESQVAGQPKWTSNVGNTDWGCPVFVPARPCLIGNNVATIQALNSHPSAGPFATSVSATDEFNFAFTDVWKLNGTVTDDRDTTLTTLFYFNNFVHDWLYDLGFDEAAGNFQDDNFGQGGIRR